LGDQLLPFAKVRGCLMGSYAKYKSANIPKFFERKEYEKIKMHVNDELCSLKKNILRYYKRTVLERITKVKKAYRRNVI
jgi:hypothetical protein